MIDLTNTNKYYSPQELPQGVKHLKLSVQGHACPSQWHIERAIGEIIQARQRMGPLTVVVIHCTHGMNRTGFVIAQLLCKLEGYSLEAALTAFNKIRTPGLWRENYVKELHACWGGPLPPLPPPPAWEKRHAAPVQH